ANGNKGGSRVWSMRLRRPQRRVGAERFAVTTATRFPKQGVGTAFQGRVGAMSQANDAPISRGAPKARCEIPQSLIGCGAQRPTPSNENSSSSCGISNQHQSETHRIDSRSPTIDPRIG